MKSNLFKQFFKSTDQLHINKQDHFHGLKLIKIKFSECYYLNYNEIPEIMLPHNSINDYRKKI